MTAQTDRGVRAPGETLADGVVIPPDRLDQDVGANATSKCSAPSQTDRSLLQQFMQNLMVALRPWHT